MRPKLFATINKTKIYHVHKEDYGKGRESVHLFSTALAPEYSEHIFDVRDLGCHVDEYDDDQWIDRYEAKCKKFIRDGLKSGAIKVPKKS
jgi:hypothetical protein